MTYSVAGPFTPGAAGDDAWRFSGATPGGVLIELRGTNPSAAQIFAAAPNVDRITLEWSRDVVIVTLTIAGIVTALTARSAVVHETQPNLYRCVPLADFDANARAFWKRVFRLLRIPGGRFLLGLMARRGGRSR